MAWGSKTERIIAENAVLSREVELLRENLEEKKAEILDLKNQLKYTQEALIAKESPEAYLDQKAAEASSQLTQEEIEQKENQRKTAAIVSRYIHELEQDTFKGPEDMMEMLTRTLGPPQHSTPLHGNEES